MNFHAILKMQTVKFFLAVFLFSKRKNESFSTYNL